VQDQGLYPGFAYLVENSTLTRSGYPYSEQIRIERKIGDGGFGVVYSGTLLVSCERKRC
jgi:hypothetical protein